MCLRLLSDSTDIKAKVMMGANSSMTAGHVEPISGSISGQFEEFEILQHQKEELELQNRRLVEKISKLRFSLQGIQNACLIPLLRLLQP